MRLTASCARVCVCGVTQSVLQSKVKVFFFSFLSAVFALRLSDNLPISLLHVPSPSHLFPSFGLLLPLFFSSSRLFVASLIRLCLSAWLFHMLSASQGEPPSSRTLLFFIRAAPFLKKKCPLVLASVPSVSPTSTSFFFSSRSLQLPLFVSLPLFPVTPPFLYCPG